MRIMQVHHPLVLGIWLVSTWRTVGASNGENSEPGTDNHTVPYTTPKTDGIHWVETFDDDVWKRWAHSQHDKYTGQLRVHTRTKEALVGDVGLLVPDEAKHYGAAVKFTPLEGAKGVPFLVQFEAKFQDGLTCGGSYIKLFDSDGKDSTEFRDDTQYVIMFGPDRCGGTDKVHFILQHRSPKTGKSEEKHCKDPPSAPHDQLTHLYRLVINPDNSFEIQIDAEKKTSGNLLTSMEPPINPAKEIDDPTDAKPADWVDEAKMDDPSSSKPSDWDEDAPMEIDDPKASMPSGWDEPAPKQIPDPSAKVPEDWDEEEDGEWEPPIIDNPACKVGCGKWTPPKISNPAYKGKWYAPKIDNPAYKGVWKARQIANPDYFVDDTPYMLPRIDSVGIDIWTMSKGIIFDNILISSDVAKAKVFADESWKLRSDIEKLQQPQSADSQGGWWGFLSKHLAALAVTGLVVTVSTVLWCCLRGRSSGPSPPSATAQRTAAPQAKEDVRKEEEHKDEEPEGTTGKAEGEEVKEGRAAEPEEEGEDKQNTERAPDALPAKPVVEGGLGDISEGN